MARTIHVGIVIATDMEALWRHTQTPDTHERWDLRFTRIEYLPRADETGAQRFRYSTRLGFGLGIEGWGESVATRESDGHRTSSLRFGSDQGASLIREGSGYWKYTPGNGVIDFETGYDYRTRFGGAGRVFDSLVFRPLMWWATAWSFDRLRLWIERGIDPGLSAVRSLVHTTARLTLAGVFAYHALIPKLIARHPEEIRLIEAAGVPPEWSGRVLTTTGVIELLYAVMLVALWRARWVYTMTAAVLLSLLVAALVSDPGVASDPFSPVSLTLALLAMCAVGWIACRDLPSAKNCRRSPRHAQEQYP